jgi:hypothetical protein
MPDHERRARGFVGAAKRLVWVDFPKMEIGIGVVGDDAELWAGAAVIAEEEGDTEGAIWARQISDEIDQKSAGGSSVTAILYDDDKRRIRQAITALDELAEGDKYRGMRLSDSKEVREDPSRKAMERIAGPGAEDYLAYASIPPLRYEFY